MVLVDFVSILKFFSFILDTFGLDSCIFGAHRTPSTIPNDTEATNDETTKRLSTNNETTKHRNDERENDRTTHKNKRYKDETTNDETKKRQHNETTNEETTKRGRPTV